MRLLLLLFFLISSLGRAQPASEEQIKTWVQELGADHHNVRQAAEDALKKQGARVRPYLADLSSSPDPEVRMRATRLLKTLGVDLYSFLKAKGTCKGEASERRTRWPFILTVTDFTPESGAFTGTIEWTSLHALHEIKGVLREDAFTFRETRIIRKGNAIIGVDYTFPLANTEGTLLKGHWKSKTPREGPAELRLP